MRYRGAAWAQYLWEPTSGNQGLKVNFRQEEGSDYRLTIEIHAPFRVNVGIAESVEQSFANDIYNTARIRHIYKFTGGIITRKRDGSLEREMAPTEFEH